MIKSRILAVIVILLSGIFFSIPFFNLRFIELVDSVFHFQLNSEFWGFGLQHLGIELIILSILLYAFSVNPSWLKMAIPVIVLLFFTNLLQFSVNIPIADDYYIILRFANQYFFTEHPSEKFSLLFSIWGESRLVTAKLFVIVNHFINGEVNIKYLIMTANGCLVVILFLFYKSMPSEKHRNEIIIISALLLFQFGFYDSVTWASVALQYQLTIVFLILSLFLISKKTISAQVACFACALLAALSFGNGLLIFPIALLYFIIEKKWKLFFSWLVSGGIFLVLFFIDSPVLKEEMHFYSPLQYFIYSCCLLGAIFQFGYQLYLPFTAGLCVWVLFVVMTLKKYYKKNFFIYALILFVILSSLMAALQRSILGIESSITNRYGIFSALVVSASVVAFFEIIQERKQVKYIPLFLCSGIIFHLLTGVFFFPEVSVRKQKLEAFMADLKNNKPYQPVTIMIQQADDSILKESIAKKIYVP